MAGKGGLTSKFYREARGLKVAAGEPVKSGAILTRQGDRWRAGANVGGTTVLYALCPGTVYFTKTKGKRKTVITKIHIKKEK
ncbi:MAG: 50S ribosomal protein L27 [Candidatus Omnitrophota bacterium]